ncbi:MAG: hypothetical protein Q7W45_14515 [Bacteroidota bacterium]|nr:hypothetical protein [Bacteroidota bacterium]MDP3147420.1 hypothetical protein [Bacteroidota bacterium]
MWYILDKDKNPVPAKDMIQANRLLVDTDGRLVALDKIMVEDYAITITVSTVFLVLDHNHSPKGKPVLFESMIFKGELNQSLNRYRTWKEAEEGHKKMVELVKNNLWVSRILDKVSAKTSNTKAITKKLIEGLKRELQLN